MASNQTTDDSRTLGQLLRASILPPMNQSDLAEELGVSQARVSRWIKGEPPGDDKVPVLARWLKLSEERVVQLVYEARKPSKPAAVLFDERVAELEDRVSELEDVVGTLLAALGSTRQLRSTDSS